MTSVIGSIPIRSVPVVEGAAELLAALELELPVCGAVVGAGVGIAGAHAARTTKTRIRGTTKMRRSISSNSNLNEVVVLRGVGTTSLETHSQKPEH
jgi:hypothetical protein